MRKTFVAVLFTLLVSATAIAQKVNTDSIKAEMEKIKVTKFDMVQTIDKYKKGVIKGDAQSMNLLGMECMSGKNVQTNLEMGLNLLDAAAKKDNVDAQYNLGNYFFIFWVQKPENDGFFSSGVKWLKKAIKGGDNRATIMLARFYYEYGKYKKESSYIDGGKMLLESYPEIDQVNDKDDNVLNAQAWLGTICLGKWRMEQDTASLREAKKWYRTLLKSAIQFPNYTQYIDSLQAVLSMGVPMRLDPVMTEEEIAAAEQQGNGRFPGMGGGGFPGMGGGGFPGMGGGGFPGMGGAPGGGQQGPPAPQAKYPGGSFQMQQFIRSNTNYPENLKNQKINGAATISFTVDTDGAIINPVIEKSADVYIMDKEALRTVMIMPDWIPAQQDGQPVQAIHNAQVTFGNPGGGTGGFGGGFGF